jgi:carbon-monoxide dehydrogenase large subunit
MSEPMFGVPRRRVEDDRFLRGRGRYLENIELPGALRAVFVRSMMPHARVNGLLGVEEALAMPGVVAVFAAGDLAIDPMPPSGNVEGATGVLSLPFFREVLAREVVRYVGEPIAVVVAGTLAQAQDAAEVVFPVLDPLPAVTDPESALAPDAPLLWPEIGTNVANRFDSDPDVDALAGADVIVSGRFVNQRLAPVPMETNGIAVVPEADGTVTAYVSTQIPFDVRDDLADLLELERSSVRVIAPDVGGGFGAKLQVYPEYLVVAKAAVALGRPVRWSETRSESMVGLTHGRGQVQHVEIGARRDGSIVGLRVRLVADMGAYPIAAFLPVTTTEMLSGVYAIPAISVTGVSVVTNAPPIAAYRGAGRPEATALIERAVDLVAAELGMDPIEVRRRNLIPADAFPFTTVTGRRYDTGSYEAAMDRALEIADVEALRAERFRRRERGDHLVLGIGIATYVEITSFQGKEYAAVEVHRDGTVTVLVGTSPQGQGHETAFAQVAAGALGVAPELVRVVHSDTALVPRGEGTWASRSLQLGGSAVVERAAEVVGRGREVAAQVLEVAVDDVAFESGRFQVAGVPERSLSWGEVAAAVTANEDDAAKARGVGLRSEGRFAQRHSTFPFGAHVAVVEVDLETGEVRSLRHVAVDDCGRILNPLLVEGQVHGGLAQGIAQALYEEVLFDESANPITGTLTTYAVPSAAEVPSYETAHTQTPTLENPLGVKGIGESATVGSTPAVQNAAVDALAHLGVRHLDLPLSPERVLEAIRRASGRAPSDR